MENVIKAVQDFFNNEDIDEGNENLRKEIKTLRELRFAVAACRQDYPDEVDDLIECLISL